MNRLFDREYALTFGTGVTGKKITGLNVSFNIVHQQGAPNTAEISVINLSEETRRKLSEDDDGGDLPLRVQFEAGYVGSVALLFRGRVRRNGVISKRNDVDWITEINCGDGEAERRRSNVAITFRPKAKVTDVLKQLVDATGLDPGNLVAKVQEQGFSGTLSEFARGLTVMGNTDDQIQRISKSLGLRADIQDGAYTAYPRNGAGVDVGVIVSPETGLVDSPELGDKGTIRARSLLQPTLRPGHQISLQSEQFNGRYRVEKATHSGTFRGNDWYTQLDLRLL